MSVQTSGTPSLQQLTLAVLHESPLNTRKHFDPAKLDELKASILASGIIEPLLVRPNDRLNGGKGAFEIAAGHRRFRAAKLAALADVPCLVRPMDDATFLEVLTIDNLQREDVHPLEEAQGYRNLLTLDRYDIPKIATRVGKSESYIYDRMKLLQLTKDAQKLFLDGRFSAGHAILLARLSPADQKRAMEYTGEHHSHGGLFTAESADTSQIDALIDAGGLSEKQAIKSSGLHYDEESLTPMKPVSVREFQRWVDEHVRFDPTKEDLPNLFPETEVALKQAIEAELKVVKITHEHYIQEEARDAKERTIGPRSWTRADGKQGSKTCDLSVMGVVAVGPGRGDAFLVCINKQKCRVHYGTEIKERERREKNQVAGKPSDRARRQDADAKRQAQYAKERAERDEQERRFKKASPFVMDAALKAMKKADLAYCASVVIAECEDHRVKSKAIAKIVPEGSSAESLLRHAAALVIARQTDMWSLVRGDFDRTAKKLGINLQQLLDDAAPVEKKEAPKDDAKKPVQAKRSTKKKKAGK